MHPNTYERAGRVRGRSGTVYWSHKAARPCRSVPRCVCADLLVKMTRHAAVCALHFLQGPSFTPTSAGRSATFETWRVVVSMFRMSKQELRSSGSACGRAEPQSARAAAPAQKKYLAVHPLLSPVTVHWSLVRPLIFCRQLVQEVSVARLSTDRKMFSPLVFDG